MENLIVRTMDFGRWTAFRGHRACAGFQACGPAEGLPPYGPGLLLSWPERANCKWLLRSLRLRRGKAVTSRRWAKVSRCAASFELSDRLNFEFAGQATSKTR